MPHDHSTLQATNTYHNPYRHYPKTTTQKMLSKFKKTRFYHAPGEYKIQTPRPYVPEILRPPEMDRPPGECVDDNHPPPPSSGNCLITTLPVELLQQIASHLIIESQICFSLTSKTILATLGNLHWKNPCIANRWDHQNPGNIIHRVSLLCFLARDLEKWTYCSGCIVLHPSLPRPRDLLNREGGSMKRECFGVKGVVDYFPEATQQGQGYMLMFEHMKDALGPVLDVYPQEDIEMMAGGYSCHKKRFLRSRVEYGLNFSARRVGKDLVFKHEHRFSLSGRIGRNDLRPNDILDFPLRVCAHHTTSSKVCSDDYSGHAPHWDHGKRRWLRETWLIGPMLTHAVASVFPVHKRSTFSYKTLLWFLRPRFSGPAISEQNQMNAVRSKEDLWWCRSCPTKFRIEYKDEGREVLVTVWQCLGNNAESAKANWNAIVRRGINNDMRRLNNEYASESREFPLFGCE